MASLRKKPHYVIVGEVRGNEVQQLFQIALTGHGCVSSIHAPSASDLLVRLGGDEMKVTKTQQKSINYFVNIQKIKMRDGKICRKVIQLTEMVNDSENPCLHELFYFDSETESFEPQSIDELLKKKQTTTICNTILGDTRYRKRPAKTN